MLHSMCILFKSYYHQYFKSNLLNTVLNTKNIWKKN